MVDAPKPSASVKKAEDDVTLQPDMSISRMWHEYSITPTPTLLSTLKSLLITTNSLPFYQTMSLTTPLKTQILTQDEIILMQSNITQIETTLQTEIDTLQKSTANIKKGDVGLLSLQTNLLNHYISIGDSSKAYPLISDILTTPKITSTKTFDVNLSHARLAFHLSDFAVFSSVLTPLYTESSKPNSNLDWDKKNRLKLYMSYVYIHSNQLSKACPLLVECLPTFSCEEFTTFEALVTNTVICACLNLTRIEFIKSIVESSEIISVTRSNKALNDVIESLHTTSYEKYLVHVLNLLPILSNSVILNPSKSTTIKNLVSLGYKQYLKPYATVSISAMAKTFNVSDEYLDTQLSGFISSKKIFCKIDKVNGVIVMDGASTSGGSGGGVNSVYARIIEEGDRVLNEVGRVGRVVDL